MSTLNVSNISDGSTSVGTSYVVNGSAKAWVNFNGTGTIAARDSLNLSSLTDNGTGDYTVSLTNAMANTNWSSQCDSNDEALGRHAVVRCTNNQGRSKTVSAVQVMGKVYRHSESDRNNPVDLAEAMNILHGDLA